MRRHVGSSWFIDVSSQQHRLLWKRNAPFRRVLPLKAFNPEQQFPTLTDVPAFLCGPCGGRQQMGASSVEVKRQCLVRG